MNLYQCEINVPKVLVGTLPVGHRFAFDSGIEHEVVDHGDSGTRVRKTSKVAKTITTTDAAGAKKSVKFVTHADSQVISSGSEVTPLGPPAPVKV